jgi:uncharacterized protein (TIGR00251 family)
VYNPVVPLKIQIVVKPGSRRAGVEKLESGEYRVAVSAPAREGRANEAVREALAEHFNCAKSRVRIVGGALSRKKRVEID